MSTDVCDATRCDRGDTRASLFLLPSSFTAKWLGCLWLFTFCDCLFFSFCLGIVLFLDIFIFISLSLSVCLFHVFLPRSSSISQPISLFFPLLPPSFPPFPPPSLYSSIPLPSIHLFLSSPSSSLFLSLSLFPPPLPLLALSPQRNTLKITRKGRGGGEKGEGEGAT